MTRITSFRDLVAWRLAMDLAQIVYRVTDDFPRREWFGLAQQMRRSAVSIPSNIAEGTEHTTPGYSHHLTIALGSHRELDTQCELATRLGFVESVDRQKLQELLSETARVIHGLRRSLNAIR
jgi:four helix bundle protein